MKTRTISICYLYVALMAPAQAMTLFFPIQVDACAYTTLPIRESHVSLAPPIPRASCSPCRRPPPIREALARADAVFVGKAIEGDEEKEETFSDGKKIVLLTGRVRFSVEWAFNGVKRSEATVIAFDEYCINYGPFTKGERYLLYAHGNENHGFYVEHCSRSQLVSSADEDLKILSNLSQKSCGVRLYGMVGHVSGIKVTATDPQGKTLDAVSKVGHFEIKGVRPNVEYTCRLICQTIFKSNLITRKRCESIAAVGQQ